MSKSQPKSIEHQRLADAESRKDNWKRWGTYLPERQWATVREDYSADGNAWAYFPFEHSHLRAYRWGEDGLLGWCDRQCRLAFSLALWNEQDPILKERLFGLTNPQGNHGEDVKELYYYLDALPTHAYAKALYKYPHQAFPYDLLRDENARRGKRDLEFEIEDTGVFDDDRYFDVQIEYAKALPNDTLIEITITNRSAHEQAALHVLPTWCFRNSWVWGCEHEGCTLKPQFKLQDDGSVVGMHELLGEVRCWAQKELRGEQDWLFTDNQTNRQTLYGSENLSPFVKDGFAQRVIHGRADAVNPENFGTKIAPWFRMNLAPGQSQTLKLRFAVSEDADSPLSEKMITSPGKALGKSFDKVMQTRRAECDAFYESLLGHVKDVEHRGVARQAMAGLLWTKQFYHYIIPVWLKGDPNMPTPPSERLTGRNHEWDQLYCRDVISMPDKWEYPWFAAWDLAFHMVPFARLDPEYTKLSLMRMLREWYMRRNGQLPAYEFDFNDVNPPVHAYACWKVYQLEKADGHADLDFLAGTFQKLILNFQWWVNRQDPLGRDLFAGGFLGLDNIGLFDRNEPLGEGNALLQADGTAWMGFFCLNMLRIALELAPHHRAYEDMASKFFEHFVAIADASNHLGGTGLWDEQDGFYYDWLQTGNHRRPLPVRSLVGLLPLLAVETFDNVNFDKLPGFNQRLQWFMQNRKDLAKHIAFMQCEEQRRRNCFLLAMPSQDRLQSVLRYMLNPEEFLSPFGIRSLSKVHERLPVALEINGAMHRINYEPGESTSEMFGGNSNWRGPIWWPINWLLVESLHRYHRYYGEDFKVECPTDSGQMMTLAQVADEIERRLLRLFLPNEQGVRPAMAAYRHGHIGDASQDPLLFHEYFHAETGRGLGATHQTGWTALVASLILKDH